MMPTTSKPRPKPHKFALPNIETPQPSRPSGIRTNAQQARMEGVERSKAAKAAADARKAKAQAELVEGRSRRANAPTRPDTSPTPTSTEGAGKSPLDVLKGATGVVQTQTRRMPQRVLVAELLAVVFLTAVREVSKGRSPGMRPFVGAFCVYLILGFAADIGGDDTARVAAGLGGLVLIAVAASTIGPMMRAQQAIGAQATDITTPARKPPRRPPGGKVRGNNLNNPRG